MSATTRSPLRFRWPVVVLVVAAVIASLTAIFWDRGPGADPGTIAEGSVSNPSSVSEPYEPTEDADWSATMPNGELQISSSVGRELSTDGEDVGTDGSARWVEVRWDPQEVFDPSGSMIWPGASLKERQEPPSRLVLVAGGDRYVIADQVFTSSESSSLVIAVAAADDLHFVVEAGGRKQRAEPEDSSSRSNVDPQGQCTEDDSTASGGVEASIDCSLGAQRAAYAPGLGWAPRGKEWLMVRDVVVFQYGLAETRTVGSWERGGDFVDYLASEKPSLDVVVDGVDQPTRTAGKTSTDGRTATLETRAYLIPADEPATVTLTYRVAATPDEAEDVPADAPKRTTVTAKTTVTLDASR